jgi:hypothetical protein
MVEKNRMKNQMETRKKVNHREIQESFAENMEK